MKLTRWTGAMLVACGLAAAWAAPATAAPPANDNFANATPLMSNTSVAIAGTNVDATSETGAGEDYCCWLYHSVWYRWTAPKTGNYRLELCASNFNTHVKVLTGTAVNALQRIASNDDSPRCGAGSNRSELTFIAGAGQEYKFQIGSQIENQKGSISGSLTLVSPSNDFFADTATLEGTSAAINGTNVDATDEADEDECCWLYHSVWYKWTAPKTGNYRIELCGSSFNTHVKVLTGTGVNALQRIANNDDAAGCGPDGKRSRVDFIAGAGQEYRIQIGSHVENQTGTIAGSLALVSPPNDFFADATPLAGRSVPFSGSNVDATNEAGEDECCWLYGSLWYRWTAPESGNYTVETCGSSFNTHLKVLTGTAVNALQRVASNNDDPGCGPDGLRSRVTFSAGAGQVYYIQVGSHAEPRGTITGSIAPAAGPPPPPPAVTPVLFPNVLPPASRPPIAGRAIRRSRGKYVLKVDGTFRLPAGYTRAQACNGTIIITVKKGKRLITARTTRLSSTCRYRKTIQIQRSKIGRSKSLTVTIRFGGNAFLAATARNYKVRVRR